MFDPGRDSRQDDVVAKWRATGAHGTFVAATGFGKTQAAIKAIVAYRTVSDGPTMVVVPTLYLKDQWERRIQEASLSGVNVWVINSLIKKTHTCDVLILDEIHKYAADVFRQVFERVTYKFVLGLTATLRDDDKNPVILTHAPVFDEITVTEALANNWISDFTVFNLALDLSDDEQEQYDVLSKKFNRAFATFGHDFQLAMSCLRDVPARDAWAKQMNQTPQAIQIAAVNFVNNMRKRKEMLLNLTSKLDLAEKIIHRFDDQIVITFSQNIDTANKLAIRLGSIAEVYHSRMRGRKVNGKKISATDVRKHAVDRFSSNHHKNTCRVLCTAQALDQGADLPDIDLAIVLSGSSRTLQGIQRYGRSLRQKEGKHARIVELYARNTQDERWLKSRQQKIPRSVIRWISNIDEID